MRFTKSIPFVLLFLIFAACSTDDDRKSGPDKSGNLKRLGTSANELLSDAKFTSMKVEVVYVNGFPPSQQTLDNLQQFLISRTFKPDGIEIILRAVESSGKAPFKIEEIVEIENQQRSAYNIGDEIAVYVYFADGSNENDTSTKVVLGSAYRNTSVVIYGKTVRTVASRPNAPSKSTIESAVLNHEFGHLFGLVDIGSPMQTNHEDSENEAHCSVTGCLMQASIQFGGELVDMVGSNVPQLEDLCIRDLQANGGK